MKRFLVHSFVLTALILAGGFVRAQSASPAPVWYHFAGLAQIGNNPDAATLKQIAALPESATMRRHLLDQLAQAPFIVWQPHLPAGAQPQPTRWHPLLADLANEESAGAVAETDGHLEGVLAVRLDDPRAGLWNTNLTQIVRAWKLSSPTVIKVADAPGWEVRNEKTATVVQIVRVRDWVVVGMAHERLTLLPAWVQTIVKTGRPAPALNDSWLKARVDFPWLSRHCPALAALSLPATRWDVTARDTHLRTTAKLTFPKPLPASLEAWRIPTNRIGEPLISFTVARGLAPLLKRFQDVAALGMAPLPNQICLWGQSNPHVQTCATIPVADATNTINQLAQTIPPWLTRVAGDAAGEFLWVSNQTMLVWQAVPFVFPSLLPLRGQGQDYVLCSFFPLPPEAEPVPPELFAQVLGRPELLYYDWELTSERLPQMNRQWQLIDIANGRMLQGTNAATFTWIKAATPLLGNTATELTKTGEREATLTRKSVLGLTGFEIATLARWLDSPRFPMAFGASPMTPGTPNAGPGASPAPAPPAPVRPR